jgi:DNA-binding NtrC family response regulator
VRELRKLVERLLVLHPDAPRWERGMLDEPMRAPGGGTEAGAPEPIRGTATSARDAPPAKEQLIALLEKCEGNVSRVAALVRRNRKQIYRWMEQHAVSRGTGRKDP